MFFSEKESKWCMYCGDLTQEDIVPYCVNDNCPRIGVLTRFCFAKKPRKESVNEYRKQAGMPLID